MGSVFRQWRHDASAWLRERGLELWLITGIWAVLTLAIYLLATGHDSPRRYQDEFLFWALAKNFAAGDGLTWRGVGLNMHSWLYPVLLAPAFWVADGIPGQYTLVHLISSMMICATIWPAYLTARLMVGRWRALLAALMVVAVPAMNYAGVIATENLGYPVFTAACGAILLALARPRPRNALLAFVLLFLAVLTRTQFVILLPVFALTLLLAALMQGRGRRLSYLAEHRSVWAGLLGVGLLALLFLLARGESAFGLYAGAFHGIGLTWSALSFWLKAFSADVYLLTLIVPVIATFAMFGRAENRRDPLIGALLALALVATIALVAQVSWFSATNPYDWRGRHIFYERYMFYLGPLFFVGLVVAWKRVSWPAALISAAVAVVIVSGFQTDALMVPFSYDSFGLSLVGRHVDKHPASGVHIGMLLARVTLVLGLVYVLSTLRRGRATRWLHWAICGFVVLGLALTQVQTWHYATKYSRQAFSTFPKPATFIDQNIDRPVGMIITSTDDPLSYFTTEFWNSRVVRAFGSDAPPIRTPIMYSPRCEFDWAQNGRIIGSGCDLVPDAWYLRSDSVVMHLKDEYKRVHPSPALPTLTLMAGSPPARIFSLLDSRQVRNGYVQGQMNVRSFLDRPGQLRVRLKGAFGVTFATFGGLTQRVAPGAELTLVRDVPAREAFSSLVLRDAQQAPTGLYVTAAELREGHGPWRSIL